MIYPDDVLKFWFGTLDESGFADEVHAASWWQKDTDFDERIRRNFSALHDGILRGNYRDWLLTPRGRLAYVIVLDQFSRNMFRDTARMYEADHLALETAEDGVARGVDQVLALDERAFLYMPFMHSEELAVQRRCVALFAAWHDALAGAARERVAKPLEGARQHCAIVERFGRFPHRNSILERATTEEEAAFLTQPGSSF